jgi:hypothetical protein
MLRTLRDYVAYVCKHQESVVISFAPKDKSGAEYMFTPQPPYTKFTWREFTN